MKAFISYCHKDKHFLTGLHEHLATLKRQKLIVTWTDGEIPAGGMIDRQVNDQIEEANLFLLLISSAFIESQYCYQREFKRALLRHKAGNAIIVPIIIRDCNWNIPALRKFKALPDDGKPVSSRHWHNTDEAFANVIDGLRKLAFSSHNSFPTNSSANDNPLSKKQREILNNLCKKPGTNNAMELWSGTMLHQFKRRFGVKHFTDVPQGRFEEAKRWLEQFRAVRELKVRIPYGLKVCLDELAATNLYGTGVNDVVRALLQEGISAQLSQARELFQNVQTLRKHNQAQKARQRKKQPAPQAPDHAI